MKYPMTEKTEKPLFEYMVRRNGKMDYYLYDNFDSALKKAVELSLPHHIVLLYEIHFNADYRDYRGQNTFRAIEGEVFYDKHVAVDLHIQFYVNAGEWLNPNEEWLKALNK